MNFEDALAAAAAGDVAVARQFFRPVDQATTTLILKHQETVKFHYDDVMPWTSLRREFDLTFQGAPLASWWEEYCGYYGCMGTGWGVDDNEGDGPPEGLETLLNELGVRLPDITVPEPPKV